jgi:hypothetical protein
VNRTVPHGANLEQDPENLNKTGANQHLPLSGQHHRHVPLAAFWSSGPASAGREHQAGAGQAAAAQDRAPSVAVLPQDVRAAPAAGRLV